MGDRNTESNTGLNVVLLGKTRAGKSSTGNTILGREAFVSKKSSRSVTRDVAVQSGSDDHFPVTVYDTPGLFDTEMSEDEIQKKYKEVLQRCESDPCVFLLVIKADRFTAEEREAVEKIEQLLGEERLKKTWILFTRGDDLEEENITINEFLNGTEELKNLVQKYDQRYHVFNNKTKEPSEQVKMLFIKIFTYTGTVVGGEDILKPNPLKRTIPANVESITPVSSLSSTRIVLLGKSGFGKSAAGNTILGQREFMSVQRMSSVTRECSEGHATVSGRSVSVVDTPGFFDTQMNPEELAEEIARSVYLSSSGPHAFLIVLRVIDRFTEQEQQIPWMIEMMFGQEVLKYSIILFTHGDQQEESVEKLIEENCSLRDLVQQCGGRYHVFNNKDLNNREQVNDLLQKIDSMIEQNGGGRYRNQMFEDALRFRREEEEQRQREEEQRKQQEEIERAKKETERVRAKKQREEEQRKQQEEKQIQEEIERAKKETEERVRAKKQREEEQRKQQEEKQIQEEIERAKKETEERVRAKKQREEERRKQREEKQIQEEIERAKKETEERVRAKKQREQEEKNRQRGFKQFFSKYRSFFVIGGIILGGIRAYAAGGILTKGALDAAGVGALCGADVGAGVGAGVGVLVALLLQYNTLYHSF